MPETPGTREAILRVALDLFRAQGYDATSLRQIAERLGITKAALYYHFRAKEQLVVELTRPFLDGLSDIVLSARTSAREGGPTQAQDLLGQYVDLMIAEHEVLSLLASDPAAINHPDVGHRAATLIRAFQAELVGPEASDADHIRVACAIGAINATASLPSTQASGGRDLVLRAAAAVLASGDEPAT